MDLPEQEQLMLKTKRVETRLRSPVTKVHPSPHLLQYRARIRMRFGENGQLGYHQAGSHTHVPISVCAIAHPRINALLPQLNGGPPDCTLEFRTDGDRIQIDAKSPTKASRKPLRQWLHSLNLESLGISGVSMNGKRLKGRAALELEVHGVRHRLSPGTFYQVNLEVNQLLVARLVEWVVELQPTQILDLYSGAGNLSLPLAVQGMALSMIESGKSAVADAREAIDRMSLNVQITVGDASRFQAGDQFFDLAILDPPRAGAPGVIKQLIVTRPASIAYISCNPSTLSRDIRPALENGYEIKSLELFDMFPQTSHAEVLTILSRKS